MTPNLAAVLVFAWCSWAQPPAGQDPPVVRVTMDNTRIERSCRLEIDPARPIVDADGNGVVHIVTPGVVVEFTEGSVLVGAAAGATPDAYSGAGVRIEGVKDVTLRGARVRGFRAGVHATRADGLVVEDCDLSGNFRQRLRSTPEGEDQADWLWPHGNEKNEWLTNYGAALYIEDSSDVTVRRVRVRNGQNGILLDTVRGAKVFDNDCSFLSGWGIAMWRTTDSVVSRNALDFCIRGYSHGVYNRGQDSAGILMFEQCSRNVIVENSATHGGDGLFGFAGRGAFSEPVAGAGCNDNVIAGNDFSFAAAHGLEMTFSFRNRIEGNRLVGNAFCGVWGGYCQETLILGNDMAENGLPGLSFGGGVNIEHGHGNIIKGNTFRANTRGVSLWEDDDLDIRKLPWHGLNHKGSDNNRIEFNTFKEDAVAIQLRKTRLTGITSNTFEKAGREIDADEESAHQPFHLLANEWPPLRYEALGETRPVGARRGLGGREAMIMGEWGPWDHESPMVRVGGQSGGVHTIEVFGKGGGMWKSRDLLRGGESPWAVAPSASRPLKISVKAEGGVTPYHYEISNGAGWAEEIRGTVVGAWWDVRAFAWDDSCDPRKDLAAWRARGNGGEGVLRARTGTLNFPFGHGGPSGSHYAKVDHGVDLPRERFGIIATAKMRLPAGRWRFTTLSDDGVRVMVDGRVVLENWTWHGPTQDSGVWEQPAEAADREIEVVVEHFEIDGYAVLKLTIEPDTGA